MEDNTNLKYTCCYLNNSGEKSPDEIIIYSNNTIVYKFSKANGINQAQKIIEYSDGKREYYFSEADGKIMSNLAIFYKDGTKEYCFSKNDGISFPKNIIQYQDGRIKLFFPNSKNQSEKIIEYNVEVGFTNDIEKLKIKLFYLDERIIILPSNKYPNLFSLTPVYNSNINLSPIISKKEKENILPSIDKILQNNKNDEFKKQFPINRVEKSNNYNNTFWQDKVIREKNTNTSQILKQLD
ncbi:MAG TPA: hypothetical protein VLL98_03850 [Rickettsiales bacterium]|nr:hypothetical protein [Rickettsiales bacterium]